MNNSKTQPGGRYKTLGVVCCLLFGKILNQQPPTTNYQLPTFTPSGDISWVRCDRCC
ncbi:MAG: hypothetical protein N2235_25730 [Fischerella sp.]|nr:hypothetical protein [Fischerella sp.]